MELTELTQNDYDDILKVKLEFGDKVRLKVMLGKLKPKPPQAIIPKPINDRGKTGGLISSPD